MTKNWSVFFQHNILPPETVVNAVDRLMLTIDGEQSAVLAMMQEEDLIDLHFSLGLAIRNAFGLYDPGSKLLTSCGVVNPDDASEVIINQLWRKLKYGN